VAEEGVVDVAVYTNVLSLCAGGGGLDLGVGLAVPDARTVCYVENEVTAAAVLVSNMEAERLPAAPLWTDLRTFDGTAWRGVVDIVIGGYPCQPFSNAGKRLGADDPRHLWPEVCRIVSEVAPEWCFFENVGAHLRLGFDEVARDLQGMGYRVAAGLFTAEEVGAPHGRERLFILAGSAQLADAERSGGSAEPRLEHQERPEVVDGSGRCCDSGMADAECERGCRRDAEREHAAYALPFRAGVGYGFPPGPEDSAGWRSTLAVRPDLAPAVEPSVRGMADGVARGLGRADQLHILGNGVVPQQAAYAFGILTEAINAR
jgi:DNA (cytosine-5)-methyltransferase 1